MVTFFFFEKMRVVCVIQQVLPDKPGITGETFYISTG